MNTLPHGALIDALTAAGLDNVEWTGAIDQISAFDVPPVDYAGIAQHVANTLGSG